MENLAKKHRKQIVNLDPFSDRRLLQSIVSEDGMHGNQLDRLNKEVQTISKIVADVGGFTAAGYLGAGVALGVMEVASNSEKTEELARQSRRKFLKQAGALVAGVALSQVVKSKAEENDQVVEFGPGPVQRWGQYNLTDFRDVAIATGVDRPE